MIWYCTDDAELEAELLALEGKAPKKGGKSPKSGGKMSMDQLDKMVAGIQDVGEGDEDLSDMSDIDENELLGELQVCVCVYVFVCV